MQKIILIVGQSNDPHIDEVSSHLRALGASPVLFDISSDTIELSVSDGVVSGAVNCHGDTRKVDFRDVCCVWNRFKQWCDYTAKTAEERSEVRFAWIEWMDTLSSMEKYVATDRWVNPPEAERSMSRKGVQHVLATKVGLRIPDTVITNDPDSILHLFERHDRLIYKPQRSSNLTDCRTILTTEIDAAKILSSREEVRLAPGIYQELIEKDHELRVTIVGDEVFPVRINSQEHEATEIDWRRSFLGAEAHEIATLDSELSGQLLEFHKRAGLVYGAYDIIIPKSGEPVFLEVNPAGQWLWMEQMLGIPISERLAVRMFETVSSLQAT